MPLEYHPLGCWRCGEALHGDDPQPHRVQIVELPEVVPVIHVPRFHQLECDRCGAWTRAESDEMIDESRYGERVVAPCSTVERGVSAVTPNGATTVVGVIRHRDIGGQHQPFADGSLQCS